MPKSLVARVRLIYLIFDALFSFLLPLAIVNAVEPADTMYALGLVRTVINLVMIGRVFGPIARWLAAAPPRPDAREVREIDEMIRRGPIRLTVIACSLWVLQVLIG